MFLYTISVFSSCPNFYPDHEEEPSICPPYIKCCRLTDAAEVAEEAKLVESGYGDRRVNLFVTATESTFRVMLRDYIKELDLGIDYKLFVRAMKVFDKTGEITFFSPDPYEDMECYLNRKEYILGEKSIPKAPSIDMCTIPYPIDDEGLPFK